MCRHVWAVQDKNNEETVQFEELLKALVGWGLLRGPHPALHSCFGDPGGVGRECLWGCGQRMPVGVWTDKERERDRQTDRQRQRQTDRERERKEKKSVSKFVSYFFSLSISLPNKKIR